MRGKTESRRRWIAVIGVAGACMTAGAGCESDFATEFREVAGPGLHSGVSSILNGVVDGVFAIVDPNPSTSDETSP